MNRHADFYCTDCFSGNICPICLLPSCCYLRPSPFQMKSFLISSPSARPARPFASLHAIPSPLFAVPEQLSFSNRQHHLHHAIHSRHRLSRLLYRSTLQLQVEPRQPETTQRHDTQVRIRLLHRSRYPRLCWYHATLIIKNVAATCMRSGQHPQHLEVSPHIEGYKSI